MATGFVSDTGNEAIDTLFSRGGMASLLTTVWLVLGALSFAAVVEHAGFLNRLLAPVVARANTRGRLISAVNASGIGLNVIAGDQYVADVLPARMFREEFTRRGLAPQMLSRAVENAGTVTSVLVPWNTCGAYISGVLGVSTGAYLPYCFFNILSPVLDVLYGFIGFKVPTIPERSPRPRPSPATRPSRRPAPLPHEEVPMSDQSTQSTEPLAEEKKRFTLPSAYTILFALIVLAALATWIVPAGTYDQNDEGAPIPGTYHEVDANPQRIVTDSITAPINGLYGIENKKGNINYYNSGTLFGAIDVALFIIVIGGFLGITMKTGAIQAGIGRLVQRLRGKERWMIPLLMIVFAIGGHDLRHGGGEPGVLRPRDHRHDRRRVRRAYGSRDRAAGMRDRDAGVDDQPVRDGNRLGVRRHPDQRRADRSAGDPDRRSRDRHLLRDAHADRVRKDPSRSMVVDMKAENETRFKAEGGGGEAATLTGKHKLILALFGLAFVVMMYGVIPWEDLGIPLPTLWWWFPEMTASFLLFSVVIGLIARMNEGDLTATFVDGARTCSASRYHRHSTRDHRDHEQRRDHRHRAALGGGRAG